MEYISGGAGWYKGNLHAHSTESDGAFDRERLIAMYRGRGYAFIALTEHDVFTVPPSPDAGFLLLPGLERSLRIGGPACYHFGALADPRGAAAGATGCTYRPGEPLAEILWGTASPQQVVNDLRANGCLVICNHPVWSMNTQAEVAALTDCFALEIYNHGCEVETRTGFSVDYWDVLLRAGRRIWGVATDDNHNANWFGDAPDEWDSYGGWVMVGAAELTHTALIDALVAGRFYSSSGPVIHRFAIEDGVARVECSPVERIHFTTYERRGYSRSARGAGTVTAAEYELYGNERYLRIECVDERGRTAWTQPVFLRD